MGCGCKETNRQKRAAIEELNNKLIKLNKNNMAKHTYKVVDGCSQEARLNFRGDKILVKTATQEILKLLYDSGHPQVEKVDKSESKKDK
jgi:hypothetical protein